MKYSVKRLRAMHKKAHATYLLARALEQAALDYQLLMETHSKQPFVVGEIVESDGYLPTDTLWVVKKIELNAGCSTGWMVAVDPANRCAVCGRADHEMRTGLSSGHVKKR